MLDFFWVQSHVSPVVRRDLVILGWWKTFQRRFPSSPSKKGYSKRKGKSFKPNSFSFLCVANKRQLTHKKSKETASIRSVCDGLKTPKKAPKDISASRAGSYALAQYFTLVSTHTDIPTRKRYLVEILDHSIAGFVSLYLLHCLIKAFGFQQVWAEYFITFL